MKSSSLSLWSLSRIAGLAAALVVTAAVMTTGGCTKPNPAVCCLDAADCGEVGIPEVRGCAEGLACVDHQCTVPSCAEAGCAASAPVCNITTDVCDPCASSDDCTRFADTPVCNTSSGGCVECVAASDCSGNAPVCESNVCRACALDAECPSGACSTSGSCVSESAIVYIDPGGTDTGTCPRSSPCRTLGYAVAQTTIARNHIVLAKAGYVGSNVDIDPSTTPALEVFIHGGGATITESGSEVGLIHAMTTVHINDLELFTIGGTRMSSGTLTRVRLHEGNRVLELDGVVTLRDVFIQGGVTGLFAFAGSIDMDRVTIDQSVGGFSSQGIETGNGANLQISNLLVYGSKLQALNIPGAQGSITNSTFVDVGTATTSSPSTVSCGSQLTIRSSIIWSPGTGTRIPVQGCNLVNVIAGPITAPGAMNIDPKFIDASARNYRLATNSPAVDAVDAGPATDFEGDARPQGARFDIGADEAAP